ncbi:TOBE domain-containing protein [Gluconobacter sp. LMG 31484]|uniref:TOBE domain-containing protein n=1 Tax=Gluconobacter vitians TaxID=2728102 RepID=A0ABR9Y8G8_9PROT|nr:TOBE domain-containing protein [Gluconobacter vitians]
MTGRVQNVLFLGTHRRISLCVAGENMTARLTSENQEEFIPGQEISVGFSEGDIMCLDENFIS